MLLVLFRHGPAVDRADPACPADPDRPLTADGEVHTRLAATGLARLGVQPDRILTSPYVRATATAKIAAQLLGGSAPEPCEELLPGADPAALIRLALRHAGTLLAVGHEPHLSSTASAALGAPAAPLLLKKAGAIVLELDPKMEPAGILLGLYAPRALRALGGSRS